MQRRIYNVKMDRQQLDKITEEVIFYDKKGGFHE